MKKTRELLLAGTMVPVLIGSGTGFAAVGPTFPGVQMAQAEPAGQPKKHPETEQHPPQAKPAPASAAPPQPVHQAPPPPAPKPAPEPAHQAPAAPKAEPAPRAEPTKPPAPAVHPAPPPAAPPHVEAPAAPKPAAAPPAAQKSEPAHVAPAAPAAAKPAAAPSPAPAPHVPAEAAPPVAPAAKFPAPQVQAPKPSPAPAPAAQPATQQGQAPKPSPVPAPAAQSATPTVRNHPQAVPTNAAPQGTAPAAAPIVHPAAPAGATPPGTRPQPALNAAPNVNPAQPAGTTPVAPLNRSNAPAPGQPAQAPGTPGALQTQAPRPAPAPGSVAPSPAAGQPPVGAPPQPINRPAPVVPGQPPAAPQVAPAGQQPGTRPLPAPAGTPVPGQPAGAPPAAQPRPAGAAPPPPPPPPPPAPTQGAAPARPAPGQPAQNQPAPGQPNGQQAGRQGSNTGAVVAGAAAGFVGGFLAAQGLQRFDQVRAERQQFSSDGVDIIREPGRTIIEEDNRYYIAHDENERFRDLGYDVRSQRQGGYDVSDYVRPDGSRVFTYTDDQGRLIRRVRQFPDGRELILLDNRYTTYDRNFQDDVVDLPPPPIDLPPDRYVVDGARADQGLVYEALAAPPIAPLPRRYTLDQVRYSPDLRNRMRSVNLNSVTFDSASWTVSPDQAARLAAIAGAINAAVRRDPREIFMVEGYTDAVGNAVDNLSLSDRRAQSVATILTRDFQVPAENLVTQGYGSQYLKEQTQGASALNRRVAVRRITPLLANQ